MTSTWSNGCVHQFTPIAGCRRWFEVILRCISLNHNAEMQRYYNICILEKYCLVKKSYWYQIGAGNILSNSQVPMTHPPPYLPLPPPLPFPTVHFPLSTNVESAAGIHWLLGSCINITPLSRYICTLPNLYTCLASRVLLGIGINKMSCSSAFLSINSLKLAGMVLLASAPFRPWNTQNYI